MKDSTYWDTQHIDKASITKINSVTHIEESKSNDRYPDEELWFSQKEVDKMIIPTSYNEVLKSLKRKYWKDAMKKEIKGISAKHTSKYIQKEDLSKNDHWIDSNWVFTIKRDSKGRFEKFNAKLVARSFGQRE